MTTEDSRAADEACISELIEERDRAIRAGDVDALMSNHAPDVVMFDALDPLRYVSLGAVRERAGQWLFWYQKSALGIFARGLSRGGRTLTRHRSGARRPERRHSEAMPAARAFCGLRCARSLQCR